MLEKPNSSKGNLLTYRPITVSTVLYRLFTKTIGSRIQHWIETESILGEKQNGFRSGRRGEDNLFVLTSAIEMSRRQKKGLICAFLDCSQAYDRVNRDRLWEILVAKGMDNKWIELLKLLYTDNNVILKHGQHVSRKVTTNEGLRQGCPLSPILFMLYISDLEHRLLEARCGFEVRIGGDFWNLKERKFFHIPGLLFADDLVLMSQTRNDLHKLLQITSNYGEEMCLQFNPLKSAVVVFSHPIEAGAQLSIQGQNLPEETSYKYLGITLCNSKNYLKDQEVIWEKRGKDVIAQMHARSLWTFNRFEISKVQWKSTAVPKLTYANGVTVMSRLLRYKLERFQRTAGRWALGLPGSTLANEFIEGELGWSSFEAREACSKIGYFARVSAMSNDRWPKAIFDMMEMCNIRTKALNRARELRSKFGCDNIRLEPDIRGNPNVKGFSTKVKKQVTLVQDEEWKERMASKPTLELYRAYKTCRRITKTPYDNSPGIRLLVLARAGALATMDRAARIGQGVSSICIRCGMLPETVEHVIMECNELYYTPDEFARRLGLLEDSTVEEINNTKRRLENWEKTSIR